MTRSIKRMLCFFLAFTASMNIVAIPACAIGTRGEIPEERVMLSVEAVPEDGEETGTRLPRGDPSRADRAGRKNRASSQWVPTVPADGLSQRALRQWHNATSGCSITCIAMVATYLTGHTYYPDEIAGYFGGHVGSNIDRLEYASDMLQLPWQRAENWHKALAALEEGKIAIVLMNSRSPFTQGQHFIVLTGLTEDGKVLVNDPSGPNYDNWELKAGFENGFHPTTISNGYEGCWLYDPAQMPEEPFIYEEEEVEVECRYPDLELTQDDIELLARMVWVEAQGEPEEGQQAVAEVVLNRLAADNFQDTLKGVIYAEGQFRSTAFLEDAEPTQTQYEAVEQALNGPYVLPKDVVFFATYAVNKNVWGKIGGHTFCYQWGMDPEDADE